MKNKPITTIKIRKETKKRLDKLKEHDRESYEEVIRKLLFVLNASKNNPERAQKIMKKIDSSVKRNQRYTKVYNEQDDGNTI
jgi:predicted CopG family antitoxin